MTNTIYKLLCGNLQLNPSLGGSSFTFSLNAIAPLKMMKRRLIAKEGKIDMTIAFSVVAGVIIVIAVIIVALFLLTKAMDQPRIRELKKYSIESLERTVYRYETEYFKFIGEENEVVREFRKLIENKDISTLHKKWGSLLEDFIALEGKAGYNGRPMIMDYYYGYELEVRELYKRKRVEL